MNQLNKNKTNNMKKTRKTNVDEQAIEEIEQKPKRVLHPSVLHNITLTEKQKKVLELIEKNKINIIIGPAGTSKTFLSCYYAIDAINSKKFDRIILTKPIQEAGEKLGFLPGDIASKIDPHYESFRTNLLEFINKTTLEKFIKQEVIEYKPLAYMRGTTHKNSLVILSEAQNCDIRQLILFITRMGKNSKIIIEGDISQYDIGIDHIALQFFTDMIKDISSVNVFTFERSDIMRDQILIEITDRYEKLKNSKHLPKNMK